MKRKYRTYIFAPLVSKIEEIPPKLVAVPVTTSLLFYPKMYVPIVASLRQGVRIPEAWCTTERRMFLVMFGALSGLFFTITGFRRDCCI